MKAIAYSYSLSEKYKTSSVWLEKFELRLKNLLIDHDIILLPELLWLDLIQFFPDPKMTLRTKLNLLSDLIWVDFLPTFLKRNKVLLKDKFLVIGTAPRVYKGSLYNSAAIIYHQKIFHQDKIYLTPWEKLFTAGKELKIFKFKNLKIATAICYDVEHPCLAEKLKTTSIDILLIPSATSDLLGNQRILRCASARSVELGCLSLAVPLLGSSNCELVDHNTGIQGHFLPSQLGVDIFLKNNRKRLSKNLYSYELPLKWIKSLKHSNPEMETRPFLKNNPLFNVVLQKS